VAEMNTRSAADSGGERIMKRALLLLLWTVAAVASFPAAVWTKDARYPIALIPLIEESRYSLRASRPHRRRRPRNARYPESPRPRSAAERRTEHGLEIQTRSGNDPNERFDNPRRTG